MVLGFCGQNAIPGGDQGAAGDRADFLAVKGVRSRVNDVVVNVVGGVEQLGQVGLLPRTNSLCEF